MITKNLPALKIHTLSEEQFKRELSNGTLEADSLYLTPLEITDGTAIYVLTAHNVGSTKDQRAILTNLNLYTDTTCPEGRVINKGDVLLDLDGWLAIAVTDFNSESSELSIRALGACIRGPQGVSGVYVGDDEMPDGYNVQVDPTGGDTSPILRIRDAAGVMVEIPAIKGDTGKQGEPGQVGPAGYTPVKGKDYFTQEDKDELVNQTKQGLGAVYKYKGTVTDILDLNNITALEVGDTYNVTNENGVNFVWTGQETGWDAVGQVVKVSNSVATGDENPVSGDAVYQFVQGALALYDEIIMEELG